MTVNGGFALGATRQVIIVEPRSGLSRVRDTLPINAFPCQLHHHVITRVLCGAIQCGIEVHKGQTLLGTCKKVKFIAVARMEHVRGRVFVSGQHLTHVRKERDISSTRLLLMIRRDIIRNLRVHPPPRRKGHTTASQIQFARW